MNDQPDNTEASDTNPAPPAKPPTPLPPDALRWRCRPEDLPFDSTADIEPVVGVIGQERAVEALRFGLETNASGQNVFVRGLTGTGRMTLVRRLMQEIQPVCPETRDRCYVHNFNQPDRPRLITLRRGRGPAFRKKIDQLADFIRDELAATLSSEGMRTRWNALEREFHEKVKQVIQPFEEALQEAGLGLVSFQAGPTQQSAIVPLVDGKPVGPDEFQKLRESGEIDDEQVAAFEREHARFQEQFQEVTAKVNEIRRQHLEASRQLRERAVRAVLAGFVSSIRAEYPEDSVATFLEELVDEIAAKGPPEEQKEPDVTRRYRVNVLLTHAPDESCPMIIENAPTMANLLGTIDRTAGPRETAFSDHHMIRAGSILRADGGYLLLDARDVMREPAAWKVLVRTLRTGRLEIAPPEIYLPWFGAFLKPEPIDLHVKVILIGDAYVYAVLDTYDPDFPNLFKVLADFDTQIPRDAEGAVGYAEVLARIAREEDLLHFDRTAIAALVDHGARIVARTGKLTTRFGRLADIAREAAFVAAKASARLVAAEHVAEAVRRTKRRADLPSRRFRELLADGTIRVQTIGKQVGQLNGLAVIQAGSLVYGFPARITASIGAGTAGVVNIEREAALSGSIHTKGFYILGGLLRNLLRTEHPLTFHASVAFEQSYGQIDGDSASGAEVCCLLSALTEVPLRQDLAMTGAIDQHGHMLPVGGVNEKIEGFYDTCRDVGLTGAQGVIIPKPNAGELMLRQDVVEACAEGRFAVYAVESIQQALELLTGMPAGTRDEHGEYPQDSLLWLAMEKAFEYWLRVSQTMRGLSEVEIEEGEGAEAIEEPTTADDETASDAPDLNPPN